VLSPVRASPTFWVVDFSFEDISQRSWRGANTHLLGLDGRGDGVEGTLDVVGGLEKVSSIRT
jgi:hypothetical protein